MLCTRDDLAEAGGLTRAGLRIEVIVPGRLEVAGGRGMDWVICGWWRGRMGMGVPAAEGRSDAGSG